MQARLASRAIGGDKPSKHEHYLQGSLYCEACGGRLLYGQHKGNGGMYEYFSCINRGRRGPKGGCTTRHYHAHEIERHVEEHYRTITLPQAVRDAISREVRDDAGEQTAVAERDAERHRKKIARLTANQGRLVQMAYDDLVSEEVLAAEQQRLSDESSS